MTVEIRAAAADEVKAALAPIFHFFGTAPTDERVESFQLEPARILAACSEGVVVGGAGAHTFDLTVPGGQLPTAGVTVVGVLPTHRRRGILTRMMRFQLDELRERGEPLAVLWASEAPIYGRFGYGLASLSGELELARDRAAFTVPFERTAEARLLEADEALECFPAVYERVAAVTPGMFRRSQEWWSARVLPDHEWRRRGGGELARVLLQGEGEDVGYAVYRLHPSWEYGNSTGSVNVIEAMGATATATRELWRFLLDIDWMQRVKASLLPVDHPLLLLVAEPARLHFTLGDALWLRIVDVEAALSGRGYADGEGLVFELHDVFCPWNEGRWLLEGGIAQRTRREADLELDVAVLGSAYLGGFTWAELARAGRVEERHPGALARADALFHTDRAPWCPEIF